MGSSGDRGKPEKSVGVHVGRQTTHVARDGLHAIWSSLDEWTQQSARAPERPTVGAMISVLLCTSYQTLLVTRLLFAGTVLDGTAYLLTRDWYGALIVIFMTIGAAVLLIWRPRQPLVVLLIECLLYGLASAFQMSDYLVFPLLFALFSCVARPAGRQIAAGIGVVWVVMTVSALVSAEPSAFDSEYLGQLVTAAATIALAVAARSVQGWRRSRLQALSEERRSEQLAWQRDRAISRTRIAAELHDSVGHGLTTIIALAEGLTGTTGDATVDEALAGINSVARESLDDTRRAVRALADPDDQPEDTSSVPVRVHEWDEIRGVLGRVRSLGVTVVFTETGRRPSDICHADLCFALTREAITNAMRHSDDLRQITVAWDHDDDVATTVTVRSVSDPSHEAGTSGHPAASETGTGLQRLQAMVIETGGTMSYGASAAGEWTVQARVLAAGEADR
ncbi:histidine kinase [Propionimicrobium sp. PCR01-08-3]|uniref:sensor histidine kinase n=1 Tax=Propionimicrobium sp. PCR01-08-3 TaxID=3052086 RepID=UPI00255C88D4|nr:histidine kinase [Propionimicrobium sp. PCR01-08-3]WIY81945.1 histidine kinase [Propionimicrobium sp. PCR01-08-3]